MPHPSRRTLLLSALLCAASINVWANPEDQGMTRDDRRPALDRFIAKKKFVKEPFYLVDLDEADRLRYEAWVNQLARSLRKLAPSRQTKLVVLEKFKPVLKKFEDTEEEDQDRFLGYLEELMDIFCIESSDGLLSTWRYGYDMTEEIKAHEAQVQARNAQALAAMTPEERTRLWAARHNAYFAAVQSRPGCRAISTDTCVPISRLADCLLDSITETDASGLPYFLVGHVGDGNFHFGYLIDPNNPQECETAEALNQQLVHRALRLGGTCTGEHGIGLHKMDFLRTETGEGAVDMMRTIKRALDPHNIMNPGKIFLL